MYLGRGTQEYLKTPDLFQHSLAGVTRILQIRGELFLMVGPLGRRRGTEAVVINLPVVILEGVKRKDNSDSVA